MPSSLTPFWLDTNVLVEAAKRHYKFDRVPKFWSFLSMEIQAGSICSPKAVYDELMPYKDRLTTWVRARKEKGLCVFPNDDVQAHLSKVADFVDTTYARYKSAEFLSGADPWIIAYALSMGGTVVTQESSSRKKKIRIPTVCLHFSVACLDTFQMLDHFGPKF